MDWTYDRQTCDFCSCRFKVLAVIKDDVHKDTKEYRCPECGKGYIAESSIRPIVKQISHRMDGRAGDYMES